MALPCHSTAPMRIQQLHFLDAFLVRPVDAKQDELARNTISGRNPSIDARIDSYNHMIHSDLSVSCSDRSTSTRAVRGPSARVAAVATEAGLQHAARSSGETLR